MGTRAALVQPKRPAALTNELGGSRLVMSPHSRSAPSDTTAGSRYFTGALWHACFLTWSFPWLLKNSHLLRSLWSQNSLLFGVWKFLASVQSQVFKDRWLFPKTQRSIQDLPWASHGAHTGFGGKQFRVGTQNRAPAARFLSAFSRYPMSLPTSHCKIPLCPGFGDSY